MTFAADRRLEGRVAVITGAAGAVGKALVARFAAEGAIVVATDRDDPAAPAAELSLSVDLCIPGACRDAMHIAKQRCGRIDALVNCAAVLLPGDGAATETDLDVWNETLRTNLTAVWQICAAALEVIERPGGSIVNVASLVALRGSVLSQVAYTSSKGGVLALTRELAVASAADGVRVNSVCPGPLSRGLADPLVDSRAAREDRVTHIPMGRLGDPAEVAEACLFLASPESSYITGTALPVDGGASAAFIASA
jgi:NAD(P)-dependent dehydrogenase (short-subunit alcohol dehydrogenase family)